MVSEKTAEDISAFKARYKENEAISTQIKRKYADIIEGQNVNAFTLKIIEKYRTAESELLKIEEEWKQFQSKVVSDLPETYN